MGYKFNPFTGNFDIVDGAPGLGLTAGGVVFSDGSTLLVDQPNFSYDDALNVLAIPETNANGFVTCNSGLASYDGLGGVDSEAYGSGATTGGLDNSISIGPRATNTNASTGGGIAIGVDAISGEDSVTIGNSATSNNSDVIIGANSFVTTSSCVVIGANSQASFVDVVIGASAIASGFGNNVLIGSSGMCTGSSNVLIGFGANDGGFSGVKVFGQSTATAASQTIFTVSNEIIWGVPTQTGAVTAKTMRTTNRTGTNVAGGNFTLNMGGIGTGTGTRGVGTIQSPIAAASGTTAHTQGNRIQFASSEIVFNVNNLDHDVRFASDTDNNLMVLNAGDLSGAGSVCIGAANTIDQVKLYLVGKFYASTTLGYTVGGGEQTLQGMAGTMNTLATDAAINVSANKTTSTFNQSSGATTAFGTTMYGLNYTNTLNGASSSTGWAGEATGGAFTQIYTGGANTCAVLMGMDGTARIDTSGTVTSVIGVRGRAFTVSGGTMTGAVGIYAVAPFTFGGGTITTATSFVSESPTAGGTNWNSRFTGSGNSYFEGKVSIGTTTAPTAKLMLGAGTASANTAPLKFTSGTNLTTAEAGVAEYNGINLFFTKTGTDRRKVPTSGNAQTSTTTVANTVTETTLLTGSIAANGVEVGDVLKLVMNGYYSTANASDTFTVRVKIGATTITSFTSSGANVTNVPFHSETLMPIRSVGGSGTLIATTSFDNNNTSADVANTATTTIDTTATMTFTVTVQWSSANVGNTFSHSVGYTEIL